MNCNDSGKTKYITTANASGASAPARNTDCQPYAGIKTAAKAPPTAPPTMKPDEVTIIRLTRIRPGLYSPASAMAFGMMAPIPSPVRKRSTSRSRIELAKIVPNEQIATNNKAPIRTGRLPTLSATTPKHKAPNVMPSRPAPNTDPNSAFDTPQSRMMAGAT